MSSQNGALNISYELGSKLKQILIFVLIAWNFNNLIPDGDFMRSWA